VKVHVLVAVLHAAHFSLNKSLIVAHSASVEQLIVGISDGDSEGNDVGPLDGADDGSPVGSVDGEVVGSPVGLLEG
jgi:hypothetical protein